MPSVGLGDFVHSFLERVVNRHDLGAVDELVAPDYRGTGLGWAPDLESLRRFYTWQARWRPDWRIDVQETVEVGDHVAVRAYAGGTIAHDDDGQSLEAPFRRDVEWLAVYRVAADRIVEVNFLASADRHDVG